MLTSVLRHAVSAMRNSRCAASDRRGVISVTSSFSTRPFSVAPSGVAHGCFAGFFGVFAFFATVSRIGSCPLQRRSTF